MGSSFFSLADNFISFVEGLEGFEKGEAQTFCDALFQLFGHDSVVKSGGIFEARIKSSKGGTTKFADCLWSPPGRDGVLIEMKSKKEKNLESHFPQVRDYWIEMNPEALLGGRSQKPKYIIICNFEKIIIYKQLSKVDEFFVSEIKERSQALNFLSKEPSGIEPVFKHNVEEISSETSTLIGELYKYLVIELAVAPENAQRFVLQCVVSMFSEDLGLLPNNIFYRLVKDCLDGQSSYDLLGGLFKQMASKRPAEAGRYKNIKYFNGGLFEEGVALELDAYALNILYEAANKDWRHVNPAIFGALFEGTMNAAERHGYGAHFTSEEDIQKIINPTIVRPWKERIARAKSLAELSKIYNEIESFVVLDPACGCGNFLFVSYLALKDVERELIRKVAFEYSENTLRKIIRGGSRVSTRQFKGIDIQRMAVEIAKSTMMIAREVASEEWNNFVNELTGTVSLDFDPGLPLDALDDCIIEADALLVDWPEFDVVVGNPPFQSKNKLKIEMGEEYVEKIRKIYKDVPGRADYCVYWFRKTHDLMRDGARSGLVGTNTIRQNFSRQGGLDYIVSNKGCVTEAVSSQVWSGDAVVHVSIVNWIKESGTSEGPFRLSVQRGDSLDSPFEFYEVAAINSALSHGVDVTKAFTLKANKKIKRDFQGQTHGSEGFLLTLDEACKIKKFHPEESHNIFPYMTGRDELLGAKDSLPRRCVIDLNQCADVFSAQKHPVVFDIVKQKVYPGVKERAEAEYRKRGNENGPRARHLRQWWKFWRSRSAMLESLSNMERYIVCVRVTKRPIFEFLSCDIRPNDALQVFAFEDDYSFGILQSLAHWEWFCGRCSTLKSDWRYTSTTVYNSFPWPQNPKKKDVLSVAQAAKNLREKRREIMLENNLSLRELYKINEDNPGNPLSDLQFCLDEAVNSAYSFPKDPNYLYELMKLNEHCYKKELAGDEVQAPGVPRGFENEELILSGRLRLKI